MVFLKILVALPLLLMAFFLLGVFGDAQTVSDLKAERVMYSKAFIETSPGRRRYQKIVIISGKKKYLLHPSVFPKGMTLDSVAELLNRSSEAVIWTGNFLEPQAVMGIQSDYLDIPPSRGIDLLNNDRKWAWWGALGSLALGIIAYLYFKYYYGLDWKLDFDLNQAASRLRADNQRRRSSRRIRRRKSKG